MLTTNCQHRWKNRLHCTACIFHKLQTVGRSYSNERKMNKMLQCQLVDTYQFKKKRNDANAVKRDSSLHRRDSACHGWEVDIVYSSVENGCNTDGYDKEWNHGRGDWNNPETEKFFEMIIFVCIDHHFIYHSIGLKIQLEKLWAQRMLAARLDLYRRLNWIMTETSCNWAKMYYYESRLSRSWNWLENRNIEDQLPRWVWKNTMR